MYIVPQKYKCDRCGHEENYSPHAHSISLHLGADPVCNHCLSAMIRAACGVMRCTVDFSGKGGSEYQAAQTAKGAADA